MNTMKKYSLISIMLLFSCGIFGQGIYNNGGKIVIGSGTYLNISGVSAGLTNETNVTDGAIALSGTLKLEGNCTNNVAGTDIFSTVAAGSEVVFSGTSVQTIGGSTTSPFTFDKLTINNPSGIILSKDVMVNNQLSLTNGLLTLGSNNLTLASSAVIGGTPSVTAMVVATGLGELRRRFGTIGSFTYPLGDNTGTAEYTPVTLNFTSGTFGTSAYAGVNLANTAYPDPFISGSYLTRYWNISQSGISGFSSDAVFKYVPADVVGTESNIYSVRISPLPITLHVPTDVNLHQLTATGLNSFGSFTGGLGGNTLNTKVFLEGPFDGTTAMSTTLNSNNLIPLTQPYDVAPWNYAGTESVASIPADVVDWVLVELRDAASAAEALPTTKLPGWPKAYFLKSNGTIVDLDGTSLPNISNPIINNNLYVIVRHRSHIDIMSSLGMTLSGNTYSYNFSNAITQAYGNSAGYKQIGTGVFGMVASDADADGNISVLDFSNWSGDFGKTSLYLNADVDMDGNVSVLDYSKWATDFGIANISPLKSAVVGESVKEYHSMIPGDK
jgi:hypothetical protein